MPEAASALLAAFTFKEFFPAFVLLVLLCLIPYILGRAQRVPGFDLSNMLKDENGKESSLRLAIVVALAITSWVVVYQTMAGTLTDQGLLTYSLTWSGSLALLKLAEAGMRWDGRLPWARTEQAAQAPTTVTTTGPVTVGPPPEIPPSTPPSAPPPEQPR